GKLVNIILYGAQLRILGKNFLPVYFDATYDLFRTEKYRITRSDTGAIPAFVGWQANLGFSLLKDRLVFNVTLDGPFKRVATETIDGVAPEDNFVNYPHLRAVFILGEGLLPGFYFDASYDKKLLRSLKDLIDPQSAVIGARINFKTGPAVISLVYSLRYNPELEGDKWEITSGLNTSLSLF
ncbi:MAG: hypothetical protein AB1798_19400, partial [Spirochaetota bacterium]